MSYSAETIRNICILGHGGSGKTSLAESMLYLTGAVDRLGKVTDGNTVCDSDAEEIRRQISISTAVAPVEYGGCKINVLDTPGYFDFAGEVLSAIRVVEAGVVLCTAKDGLSVGAERTAKYLEKAGIPRIFYISKLDEENGDFNAAFNSIKAKYGNAVCAFAAPASDGAVIDVVHNIAYKTTGNKTVSSDIPAADADMAAKLREALVEAAAGASEALMEKFFDAGELSDDEMAEGIRLGLADGSLIPVFCGSAYTGTGTELLLNAVVSYVPSPLSAAAQKGENANGEETEVKPDPNAPVCAFVFKTVSDQYGKYSFVKVLSGKITADMSLANSRTDSTDKLGRLYIFRGKKSEETKELVFGDIGAIGKMDYKTGDTICDSKHVIKLVPVQFAEPCYSMAIAPKTKGHEEKVSSGLTRLNEEDISFQVTNNPETHQMVISAAGDIQIDVLCSKLKNRFGVEVELSPARVPYREKIRKKVRVQGRHKKQSGGSGQFGDVWIEFEPGDQEELVFEEKVFGGSVPKQFFPAVEKGLREAVSKGVLASYPMVFLKATLVDGSYHPVDSNEMAFKTAAQLAYKAGIPQAAPTLLEPIGSLAVTVPSDNMGDVIGDLNKRRGRVMGMNPADDAQTVVEAEVPMAEMSSYAIDLRSMTQSRGSFVFKFERYEEAPAATQEKVIAEAKQLAEGE